MDASGYNCYVLRRQQAKLADVELALQDFAATPLDSAYSGMRDHWEEFALRAKSFKAAAAEAKKTALQRLHVLAQAIKAAYKRMFPLLS